jgi:hypothetical protein
MFRRRRPRRPRRPPHAAESRGRGTVRGRRQETGTRRAPPGLDRQSGNRLAPPRASHLADPRKRGALGSPSSFFSSPSSTAATERPEERERESLFSPRPRPLSFDAAGWAGAGARTEKKVGAGRSRLAGPIHSSFAARWISFSAATVDRVQSKNPISPSSNLSSGPTEYLRAAIEVARAHISANPSAAATRERRRETETDGSIASRRERAAPPERALLLARAGRATVKASERARKPFFPPFAVPFWLETKPPPTTTRAGGSAKRTRKRRGATCRFPWLLPRRRVRNATRRTFPYDSNRTREGFAN